MTYEIVYLMTTAPYSSFNQIHYSWSKRFWRLFSQKGCAQHCFCDTNGVCCIFLKKKVAISWSPVLSRTRYTPTYMIYGQTRSLPEVYRAVTHGLAPRYTGQIRSYPEGKSVRSGRTLRVNRSDPVLPWGYNGQIRSHGGNDTHMKDTTTLFYFDRTRNHFNRSRWHVLR